MGTKVKKPRTLQEAIIYFSDPNNSLNYVVAHRWPNGAVCPTCGRTDPTRLKNWPRWYCRNHHATRQFSARTGTIFVNSQLSIGKWLTAVWMITNATKRISSYDLARTIGVAQKTGLFMLHRIRKAAQTATFQKKVAGHLEVDETLIGGETRFMYRSKRTKVFKCSPGGKTAVIGLLDRGGKKQWLGDFDGWYKGTCVFLEKNISIADKALFIVIAGGGLFETGGFNGAHMGHRKVLLRYINELRRIIDGYMGKY